MRGRFWFIVSKSDQHDLYLEPVMILRNHYPHLVIVSSVLAVLLLWGSTTLDEARAQQFTPPSQITINMHVLRQSDGAIDPSLPDTRCYSVASNRTRYGCTFFEGDVNRPYPFSTDAITIGIEDHQYNNTQQGYLHNVTPIEVAIGVASQGNKPLSCVQAQAIAARTYAYYHIDQGSSLNNSADYQVYVPYQYHSLTSAQQQWVDEAMSGLFYMTANIPVGYLDPIRGLILGQTTTTGPKMARKVT
jgi:hypothetical protein